MRGVSSSLDSSGCDEGSGFGMSLGLEDLGAKRDGRLAGAPLGPSRSSRSIVDIFPAGGFFSERAECIEKVEPGILK